MNNERADNIGTTNKTWSYDVISKLLHWILAILLIGLIGLGWYMMSIEDQSGSDWYLIYINLLVLLLLHSFF